MDQVLSFLTLESEVLIQYLNTPPPGCATNVGQVAGDEISQDTDVFTFRYSQLTLENIVSIFYICRRSCFLGDPS